MILRETWFTRFPVFLIRNRIHCLLFQNQTLNQIPDAMKNLLPLIIMMFSLGTVAQETYLSAEDIQREKDLRQARVKEIENQPIQILHKPAAFGYKMQSDQAMPMDHTFKNDNGVWLNWDNGLNDNALGSGEDFSWDVAARFEPSDLAGLEGNFITRIRFFLFEEASVTLRIWQGAFAED